MRGKIQKSTKNHHVQRQKITNVYKVLKKENLFKTKTKSFQLAIKMWDQQKQVNKLIYDMKYFSIEKNDISKKESIFSSLRNSFNL